MKRINTIDNFYREKEILEHFKKWTNPLRVDVNDGREVVEINFNSAIGPNLTKTEKIKILRLIVLDLEHGEGLKDIFDKLEKRLKANLTEMRKEIKKDLHIVKGGEII